MPAEMYGKSWFTCLQVRRLLVLYMLDAEAREESNDTKIVFIALSMQKLLTRSVRPTQHEQTIGTGLPRRKHFNICIFSRIEYTGKYIFKRNLIRD